MISPHYWIHAVTLMIIGLLAHKLFVSESLIGSHSSSSCEGNDYKAVPTCVDTCEGAGRCGCVDSPESSEEGETSRDDVGEAVSSSVWCHGSNITDRICQFRNLCFHPEADQFVFFAGNESIVKNLPESDIGASVLELSSVANHNAHHFSLVTLSSEAGGGFTTRWITTPSLAFSRFKPDNLMHVLHDDILPVHHTLSLISDQVINTGKFDVQLVFLEGWDPGEYADLYALFSLHPPIFRKTLSSRPHTTCFQHIYLGLLKSTVWYQYGFTQPQGPVPGHTVTAREIHSTTRFIRRHLHAIMPQNTETRYFVLLCRRENRLILNEAGLSQSMARKFKVKIIHVSSETHAMSEMIAIVSMAAGLVGMHGALMSLIMFLQPGSVVVELFPFGVNPESYTPYKTLAGLDGMGLVYRSWKNTNSAKSISHPDWPAELGGIEHLSVDEQLRILSETEVRPHLCCDDPSWLFRIYQDTEVNVDEVLTLLADAVQDTSHVADVKPKPVMSTFPSPVREIRCSAGLSAQGQITLTVIWREPWNAEYLSWTKLHYEVLVSDKNSEDHVKFKVSGTTLSLPVVDGERSVVLWIRAVLDDDTTGQFIYVSDCHT